MDTDFAIVFTAIVFFLAGIFIAEVFLAPGIYQRAYSLGRRHGREESYRIWDEYPDEEKDSL